MVKKNKDENSNIRKSDDTIVNADVKSDEINVEKNYLLKELKRREGVENKLKTTRPGYRFISENVPDLICLHDSY